MEGSHNLFRLEFAQSSLAELGIDAAFRKSRRPRLRAVFADLESIARNCDCRFVVAPVPPRRSLDGSIDTLRKAVGKIDLEVVDVVPAIERMLREEGRDRLDLFWVNDNHLNEYGYSLYARALAEALREPPRSAASNRQ